jgi:hypothetical protein
MSAKILQLFAMLLLLLAILIAVDKYMSSEGQIFQIVAGAVSMILAVFYSAIRHEFGLPDDKTGSSTPNGTTAATPVGPSDPKGPTK